MLMSSPHPEKQQAQPARQALAKETKVKDTVQDVENWSFDNQDMDGVIIVISPTVATTTTTAAATLTDFKMHPCMEHYDITSIIRIIKIFLAILVNLSSKLLYNVNTKRFRFLDQTDGCQKVMEIKIWCIFKVRQYMLIV